MRDEDGVAMRCTGAECPAQRLRNIIHFASREAMDIEGLGSAVAEALIKAGLLTTPAGIYYLEAEKVAKLDRMGKKSAPTLFPPSKRASRRASRGSYAPSAYARVGQKAGKVLAAHFGTLDRLMEASLEELCAVPDIGEVTAGFIKQWFEEPQARHQIELLRAAGVSFESGEERKDNRFEGKTFVLTGTLDSWTRDEAAAIIESYGGKTAGSVSKKDQLRPRRRERGLEADQGRGAGRRGDRRGALP